MASQVTGYQYFSFFLLFIGNPIEKVLGINFDKRGWHTPLIDEVGNPLSVGVIEKATLYGENEGGVAGQIHARYGTNNQEVVSFYKDYMDSKELPASAFPYQSYLAFPDFYVGNSGYMKEMLLWPKRTRIRNDGCRQWYEVREDGAVVCEIEGYYINDIEQFNPQSFSLNIVRVYTGGENTTEIFFSAPALSFSPSKSGGGYGESGQNHFEGYHNESQTFVNTSPFDILIRVKHSARGESASTEREYETLVMSGDTFTDSVYCRNSVYDIESNSYVMGAALDVYFLEIRQHRDFIKIDAPDINPIHKIREILTDDMAMNKPESSVNDENFIKAADWIFDEALGISWSITEKSCIDAINELCYHIEAGIRINRQTGLYEMVLFRDDWFEDDEIHTIAEIKIKSMQYEITNADEVINQVNVNFYDRANIKNSSFSISENGLIQTLGRVNAETLDFLYFMNMRNAEVVANWKLKQLSTGAFKGSFTTGWREARKWNRYDLIRLPWSKRWTGTILVRIMSINLGGPTNNEVSIDFIEVVPSTGMMNTTIVADEPIEKPLPPQACQYEPFEMPYYLAVMALGQRQVDDGLAYESNFGLVGVVAEQPQSNSLYAVMMTNNYDEWVRAGSIQYSETVDSDQNISKTSTSFTVKNWKKIANFPVGTLIQCGKEWLTGFAEWMVFQGVDPDTGVVSVKRGALDTQPQEWDLGLKLYFCGNDVAYDQAEYLAGEKVLVSALTTTPSGVLELKGSHSVEMKARAIRPYPPANVKINSGYWPAEIETDLIITWVDRNRLQQTGGEIIGWYEGGVTIETNTQTHLILSQLNENQIELATSNANVTGATSYTMPISVMQANTRFVKIILKTIRDGYECSNPFVYTVKLSQFFSAPYDLTVEFKND